jgi:PIN domain nuclease of toxin-antitoxin system
MKVIADTCIFLRLASAEEMLSTQARALLEDSGNMLLLSAAFVSEIGVKHAPGRLRLPNDLPPADFIPEARSRNGLDTLPITETDALQLPKLPRIHQDPSERMLICQAIANQAVIVTPEPVIAGYPVSVQW